MTTYATSTPTDLAQTVQLSYSLANVSNVFVSVFGGTTTVSGGGTTSTTPPAAVGYLWPRGDGTPAAT